MSSASSVTRHSATLETRTSITKISISSFDLLAKPRNVGRRFQEAATERRTGRNFTGWMLEARCDILLTSVAVQALGASWSRTREDISILMSKRADLVYLESNGSGSRGGEKALLLTAVPVKSVHRSRCQRRNPLASRGTIAYAQQRNLESFC